MDIRYKLVDLRDQDDPPIYQIIIIKTKCDKCSRGSTVQFFFENYQSLARDVEIQLHKWILKNSKDDSRDAVVSKASMIWKRVQKALETAWRDKILLFKL